AMDGPVRVGYSNRKHDQPLNAEVERLQMTAGPIDFEPFESAVDAEIARFAPDLAAPRSLTRAQRLVTRIARHSKIDDEIAKASIAWRKTHAERLELERSFPHVMVMQEMPTPREAFVLLRGQYDQHGEAVLPDVPQSLGLPLPDGAVRNRLTLA